MASTPPQQAKIACRGPRLEEAVDQRGTGLSLGRQEKPAVASDPARQSYNDERLIVFLRDLKKHMRGQKVILIWDGLPAHRSRNMKQYLESQRSWLQVETLPGYSPDLNPVEDLWSNIKGQELANRCVAGLGEAEDGVSSGMARVRQSMLPFSFLHHAGLFFDPSCHPITRDSVTSGIFRSRIFMRLCSRACRSGQW
jgi:putative transposase